MKVAPPVDDLVLARLRAQWEMRAVSLRRVTVGFPDSLHYVAETSSERLFLTVDSLDTRPRLAADPDIAFRTLSEAFEGAYALRHSAGLEFVLAPVIDREGRVSERLTPEYSLTVFPFVG